MYVQPSVLAEGIFIPFCASKSRKISKTAGLLPRLKMNHDICDIEGEYDDRRKKT